LFGVDRLPALGRCEIDDGRIASNGDRLFNPADFECRIHAHLKSGIQLQTRTHKWLEPLQFEAKLVFTTRQVGKPVLALRIRHLHKAWYLEGLTRGRHGHTRKRTRRAVRDGAIDAGRAEILCNREVVRSERQSEGESRTADGAVTSDAQIEHDAVL